jgi:hypothetical protein
MPGLLTPGAHGPCRGLAQMSNASMLHKAYDTTAVPYPDRRIVLVPLWLHGVCGHLSTQHKSSRLCACACASSTPWAPDCLPTTCQCDIQLSSSFSTCMPAPDSAANQTAKLWLNHPLQAATLAARKWQICHGHPAGCWLHMRACQLVPHDHQNISRPDCTALQTRPHECRRLLSTKWLGDSSTLRPPIPVPRHHS